jgi:hypothetical protein
VAFESTCATVADNATALCSSMKAIASEFDGQEIEDFHASTTANLLIVDMWFMNGTCG